MRQPTTWVIRSAGTASASIERKAMLLTVAGIACSTHSAAVTSARPPSNTNGTRATNRNINR